jgi:hypothetical protein
MPIHLRPERLQESLGPLVHPALGSGLEVASDPLFCRDDVGCDEGDPLEIEDSSFESSSLLSSTGFRPVVFMRGIPFQF